MVTLRASSLLISMTKTENRNKSHQWQSVVVFRISLSVISFLHVYVFISLIFFGVLSASSLFSAELIVVLKFASFLVRWLRVYLLQCETKNICKIKSLRVFFFLKETAIPKLLIAIVPTKMIFVGTIAAAFYSQTILFYNQTNSLSSAREWSEWAQCYSLDEKALSSIYAAK